MAWLWRTERLRRMERSWRWPLKSQDDCFELLDADQQRSVGGSASDCSALIVLRVPNLVGVDSLGAMFSSLLPKAGFRPGLALHSTIPRLLMAAAVAGGTGSLLSAGSAKAIVSCDFGGYGANDCAVSSLFTLGDKKLTIVSLPTAGQGTITLSTPSLDVFNILVDFLPGPVVPTVNNATFAYDLEIFTGTKYFSGARLDSLNSALPTTQVVKAELLGPYFATLTSINGIPDPLSPPLPFFEPIPGNVKKIRVLDTYSVTVGGELSEFSNTFRQSEVPGPLPVLGAGMAFGFSRKLRNRIKASAVAKA